MHCREVPIGENEPALGQWFTKYSQVTYSYYLVVMITF